MNPALAGFILFFSHVACCECLGTMVTTSAHRPCKRTPSTEQRMHCPSASHDTRAPNPLPHGALHAWLTTSAALMAWLDRGLLPSTVSGSACVSTPTTQTQLTESSNWPYCLRCNTSLSSAQPPCSRTVPRQFIDSVPMALKLRISHPGNSAIHPWWSSMGELNDRETAMPRRGRCVITAALRLRHHSSPSGSDTLPRSVSGNM